MRFDRFQFRMFARLAVLAATFIATAVVTTIAMLWDMIVEYCLTPPAARVPVKGDVVLITGASSGIGLSAALHLSRNNFYVLAGCRRQDDFNRLLNMGLHPLILDVTNSTHIEAALKMVEDLIAESHDRVRFAALINNAGIVHCGPFECISNQADDDMVSVNLLGPMFMTRSFLPLIRHHQARIVYVASISSFLPSPSVATYTATKFGLLGLVLSLVEELRPFGVSVSIIEPAQTATPIFDKSKKFMNDLDVPSDYQGFMNMIQIALKFIGQALIVSPQLSTDHSIMKAVTSKYPRLEYRPSYSATLQRFLAAMPSEIAPWTMVATAFRAFNHISSGWASD